jgi:hypothetical protein
MFLSDIKPSQRVRVTQSIQTRDGPWQTQVDGRVVSFEWRPTGSWFAHGKNDKFWLRRLRLEKDDGEIVDLAISGDTRVTSLDDRPAR